MDAKKLNEGHRDRLRSRLIKCGTEKLSDYEVVEILLTLFHSRRDTKPVAKRLLKTFGSFNAILAAEPKQLLTIDGLGPKGVAVLKSIHEIICRFLKEQNQNMPLIDNISKVVEYCKARMGYLSKESNRVLFLNTKNYLIDEIVNEGTVDYTEIYPREIIARALELRANAIIIVHNHPSGDPSPSEDDFIITKKINQMTEVMDISLHDHIIVSRNGYYSMRANNDI